MKTRLLIFISALLLLPPAGFLLSGNDWNELFAHSSDATNDLSATAITLLLLSGYTLLTNLLVKLRTGNNPLTTQRNYFLTVSAASAVTGWLLVYLSFFATSLAFGGIIELVLDTLLFALLAPAALSTRALLGSFPGLLKLLARGLPIPSPTNETKAMLLVSSAGLGLLGIAAMPSQQSWLLWLAPLLLLFALQLMWHESTILLSLKSGNWSRPVCAALAGLIVGNLTILIYQIAGGIAPSQLLAQTGYLLFGLLSLQLGDVLAEHWRGTQRRTPTQTRKPFPIPVVVKK